MALPTRPIDCVDEGYPTPELLLDSSTSYRMRVINVGYVGVLLTPLSQRYNPILTVFAARWLVSVSVLSMVL